MVGPNAACGEPIRGSFGDADYWVSIIRYVDDSGGNSNDMLCAVQGWNSKG